LSHASAAATGPLPHIVAGRYGVERKLGEGGMAEVFAVADIATGQRLALKRLRPSATKTMVALFEREYQTLAGLKHPCIVEVYDYGTDNAGPYYTMELLEADDLSRSAPMPWREACRVLRDAASVLGLLHARHLLHRDLSPRNFLRHRDGRLKLIDFGALASFGLGNEVVGTPPFVAPEALQMQPLDQRADVFGLGALAYWLLTGAHAFPARALSELPDLWQRDPTPPSDMLALLGSNTLERIPPALDALVISMLRIEPAERLQGTAELLDRLNVVADLAPESAAREMQGYLDSKVFVGRERERERARTLLQTAASGRVQTLLIEGEPGIGRSRFMRELVVEARLAGALTLTADDADATRPYGTAISLLTQLLRVLPEPTRRILSRHAGLLGAIAPELGEQLDRKQQPANLQGHGEQRLTLLSVMRKVVQELAGDRLLAIFVDDAHEIDEASQALLNALSSSAPGARLMLVLTVAREYKKDGWSALANLRTSAARLHLLPLTTEELLQLLRSVFGQPPYLERLAERLHRASEGNPAYALELAQHLVHTGAATYHEGVWTLPSELSQVSLPSNRYVAKVEKLEQLSADARKLASQLSVPHEPVLGLAECVAVAALPRPRVVELLDELVRERVLTATGRSYRFAHADVQRALYEALSEPERVQSHRRLAEQLLSTLDPNDARSILRAALHFLHAGDVQRGHAQVLRLQPSLDAGDLRWLAGVAPLVEQIYLQLTRLEQDDYGKVAVLGLLALAGFFAERRYAERYGDLAIATGERVLRQGLARRLSRWLGGRLALMIALVVAGIALHRRKDRAPTVRQVLRLYISSATALAGTSLICLDAARSERYAEVLRPFRVLGRDHAAEMTYRFVANALPYQRDRLLASERQMHGYLARLEDPAPIAELLGDTRKNYIAGTLMSLGVLESWCDSDRCLATADKLEQFSPLHAMSADHLRASYYSSQGDIERADHYRKRVEMHAVELGSAWQVDIWASAEGIKIGLRTRDAAVLKRTVQELNRLSRELPPLADVERTAHAAYLVMRGKHADAAALLEGMPSKPRLGRVRSRGVLASAYNGLGEHEKARQVCLEALATLEPEEAKYVVMNLNVHIELAMAEAGLRDYEAAKRRLDALLTQHAPGEGAITLGSLHEARAEVALRARDFGEAREHLTKMEGYYRTTRAPTLIELVPPLRRAIARAENPRLAEQDGGEQPHRGQHTMMRVRWLLSQSDDSRLVERARRGLQLALELTHADEGFLVLAGQQDEVAHLGNEAPSAELVAWAEQNMSEADADEQTLMTEEVHSSVESNYKVVGNRRFCVVPLLGANPRQQTVVAALVLGFEGRVPRMPEPAVMRAIAVHLAADTAASG
jgi:hypothetical protein